MAGESDSPRSKATGPDSGPSGCWAPGALIIEHKLVVDRFGCRRLVPAGPRADNVREAILVMLAASGWPVIEALVADLLDTLAPPSGSLTDVSIQRFHTVWLGILEAEPRSQEERGLVVLREKLRMLTSLHIGTLLHTNFIPEIDGSKRSIERLSKLYLDVAASLRQQKMSGLLDATAVANRNARLASAEHALKKRRAEGTAANSDQASLGDRPQAPDMASSQPEVQPSAEQPFSEAAE